MNKRALVLASASPRRRTLLAGAGVAVEVRPSAIDERKLDHESPRAYAQRLACAKASAVATPCHKAGDTRPVLAADTIVVIADDVLGKPTDKADAARMLRLLAGRSHTVTTAFCIIPPAGAPVVDTIDTRVCFKPLTPAEIDAYLAIADWSDKAGAYAIQDSAAFMVRRIEGSYTNVVGLPLCEVIEALDQLEAASRPAAVAQ